MIVDYIHYETLNSVACNLGGGSLVFSQDWDRVTCPECLKRRGKAVGATAGCYRLVLTFFGIGAVLILAWVLTLWFFSMRNNGL